jgi:hypothetical protein
MTACKICAAIPPQLTVNTGREVPYPKATHPLKPLRLGLREDLWECFECGATYVWEDDTAPHRLLEHVAGRCRRLLG